MRREEDIEHGIKIRSGIKLIFPSPNPYYMIKNTIDLSNLWHITIECPMRYDEQWLTGKGDLNPEINYRLFHWHGKADGIMVCLHYSFDIVLRNISLNGRNLASVGFSFSKPKKTEEDAGGACDSSVKFLSAYDISAIHCGIGCRIGDWANGGPDDFPIAIYNARFSFNKNQGIKICSGNAGVRLFNPDLGFNGTSPDPKEWGCNLLLTSGELDVHSYGASGNPKNADIVQESGGLRIYGGWSDVKCGLFLKATGMIQRAY